MALLTETEDAAPPLKSEPVTAVHHQTFKQKLIAFCASLGILILILMALHFFWILCSYYSSYVRDYGMLVESFIGRLADPVIPSLIAFVLAGLIVAVFRIIGPLLH